MKAFVFAYPIPEYVDHCIESAGYLVTKRVTGYLMKRDKITRAELDKQREANTDYIKARKLEHKALTRQILQQLFYGKMNRAIEERYRNNGYQVHWVMFAQHQFSPLIIRRSTDRVIEVELTFQQHTSKKADGTYPYPNADNIVQNLEDIAEVVVAGYHAHDCVDKIAAAAHAAGHTTLIDEELTHFFLPDAHDPDFKVHQYPSVVHKYLKSTKRYDRISRAHRAYEQIVRPWLYQWPIKEKPINANRAR